MCVHFVQNGTTQHKSTLSKLQLSLQAFQPTSHARQPLEPCARHEQSARLDEAEPEHGSPFAHCIPPFDLPVGRLPSVVPRASSLACCGCRVSCRLRGRPLPSPAGPGHLPRNASAGSTGGCRSVAGHGTFRHHREGNSPASGNLRDSGAARRGSRLSLRARRGREGGPGSSVCASKMDGVPMVHSSSRPLRPPPRRLPRRRLDRSNPAEKATPNLLNSYSLSRRCSVQRRIFCVSICLTDAHFEA